MSEPLYNARQDSAAVAFCRRLLGEAALRGFGIDRLLAGGGARRPAPPEVREMRLAILMAARSQQASYVALERASGGAIPQGRWRDWFHNQGKDSREAAATLAECLAAAAGVMGPPPDADDEDAADAGGEAAPPVAPAAASLFLGARVRWFRDDPAAVAANRKGKAPAPDIWTPGPGGQ